MKALVIGAGSIARRHLRNLRTISTINDVGVMTTRGRVLDPHPLSADTLLLSLEEALEWRPQRVVIASPSPFHLAQARCFVEAGIPVLIEKPLSHNWQSCLANRKWLIHHERLISVGYNLRYSPSAQFMQSLVARGDLQKVSSLHIEVGQYLPDWRPDTDYRTQVSARRALGGGAILELSHEIDLLLWLMGRIRGVYCQARTTGQLEIDVEDTVDAIFTLESGVCASLHMDFLQRRRVRQFKLVGTEGNFMWNLAEDTVDVLTAARGQRLFSTTTDDRNALYVEELRDFVEGGRCAATVAEALDVMHAVDAMKQSALDNHYVSLEPAHG